MLILFIIGWVISGILAYGITFAFFQRNWPTTAHESLFEDICFSSFIALLGYAGLLSVVICSKKLKYGLKYNPKVDDN